ncbi:MAG TPA: phosphoserine phosphatase SerB [Stellaceae bacterium]|nr:phosphoserine phosphatase SerB [Stellaceae bacterium]
MPEFVLTLVAAAPADAEMAATALRQAGATVGMPNSLAPEAFDLPFEEIAPESAEHAVRDAFPGRALDVIAQPALGRRKKLLVIDLESTLIENEMLEELAAFAGVRDHVAAITRRAMNGEIDFLDALNERVGLLSGQPSTILETAAARIRLMPGAAALVRTMRASGATCAIVSGGFRVFAEPVREQLECDIVVANSLEVKAGQITGRLVPPVFGREAKLATLKKLAAELGLPLAATLAAGDGANDLPMLKAAGLGIAFHGRPAVRAEARWRIDHADLRALLYAQGYRVEEIVER